MINVLEVKKWVAALRTGGYSKIEKFCRTQHGFCATGVGLDISEAGYWQRPHTTFSTSFSYLLKDGTNVFPYTVISKIYGLNQDQFYTATKMNDNGKSFTEIADYLESLLE